MDKLFKNGYVYMTETRMFRLSDILVCNGKISVVDFHGTPGNGVTVIDCRGLYIMPGLVDVHTHGRAGFDFNTADDSGVKAMRHSYATVGTTSVMATLASAPLDSLKSSIMTAKDNTPCEDGIANIIGVHLEGRYLSEKRRGAHAASLLAPLYAGELTDLLECSSPMPTHVSAAFELDGGREFAAAAIKAGATCSLAHTDATYDEAIKAVSFGITSFTHTFNAMRPVHHREPGGAVASLMCDGAYSEFICDGEHIHPAMIKLASRLKPRDRFVLITDSMEATGCPDGEYAIAGLPVFVKNGRAVNSDGALAGSTLDLFTALCNYMKFTGLSLEEALPAATSNPAAMVGVSDICGEITAGRRADFIMTDNKTNPVLKSVVVGGETIL